MKILVVHNQYQSHQVGGEDVVVAKEIAGLTQLLPQNSVFQYVVHNDDIQLSHLAINIWGDTTHADNIKKLVQEHHITLVHVHNFFPLLTPSVFQAAKEAGAMVVHTLHNYRWWCRSGLLYRNDYGHCEQCIEKKSTLPAVYHGCYRGSRVQSLVANLAFGWYEHQKMRSYIDAYFVLTEFQDQKLRALLPDNKIYLKPNFIEVPISIYPAHEKKNYLFVGRLEPSKGIELLLETWLKLPSHFMLTLIGTEDYGIYQQKYQRENIRFLGKQPRTEVLQHMARAKYVLQTSLWVETFGLTIIEALSLGTPVIGFNIGTRPEFIQHEINGFLCEPNDFEQTLLKADDYLLYAQLSENAAQSAQPYYEPTILDQQINLYHQIVNSR